MTARDPLADVLVRLTCTACGGEPHIRVPDARYACNEWAASVLEERAREAEGRALKVRADDDGGNDGSFADGLCAAGKSLRARARELRGGK